MPQTGKIVICNEHFSGNLGDGVLSGCLAHLVRGLCPDADLETVDLSGRERFAVTSGPVRESGFRARVQSLAGVRKAYFLMQWWRGGRRRFRAWLAAALEGAGVLLIGGGQLLMDNDWYFPIRLYEAVKMAEKREIPVAFTLVGVGARPWSRVGGWLLRRAIGSPAVKAVLVRDEASGTALAAHMGGALKAPVTVAVDPAIAAAEAFGVSARGGDEIGLGIMAPHQLASVGTHLDEAALLAFWVALVEILAGQGRRVVLFTNGLPGDERFLAMMARRLEAVPHLAGAWRSQPCARNPTELVAALAGYQAVVAFRLHACIVATALDKPVVALAWDDKVAGFMARLGRGGYVVPRAALSARRVAESLEDALAHPPLPEQRLACVAEVKAVLASPEQFQTGPLPMFRDTPDYIEVDTAKKVAKLVRVPALADVPYAVKMEPNLVVEYYSR